MTTVDELYGEIWPNADAALEAALEERLAPRSLDTLYDAFGSLGVDEHHLVLDAGCRDARHAVELVRRLGCRVLGVDTIELHVKRARALVSEAGLAGRIDVVRGRIEELPVADAAVDAVWCRDVLNHVDLERGLSECARVLRPRGRMLVYLTVATPELEPQEARRLFEAVALMPESMDAARFARTAEAAGFELLWQDDLDSEAREHMIEQGTWDPTRDLLRIARLRRREADLVQRHGRARYEATRADALWGIYQLLGKLRPTVYALERRVDG